MFGFFVRVDEKCLKGDKGLEGDKCLPKDRPWDTTAAGASASADVVCGYAGWDTEALRLTTRIVPSHDMGRSLGDAGSVELCPQAGRAADS